MACRSSDARALDLSAGISIGGILAGAIPRLAVSPQCTLSWSSASGLFFAAQEMGSILPAINSHGPGVYNTFSVAAGYAWKEFRLGLGPTFSIYSMPACSAIVCRRVAGLSVGGHLQFDMYFGEFWGLSANVNIEWVGGESIVLPGSMAATALVGPVARWSSQ